MVSKWRISWMYDKYIEIFENTGIIGYNNQTVHKPNKFSIENSNFNIDMRNTSVNNSDDFLIEKNGRLIDIHQLPISTLCWLPIGLTKILQIQITLDHEKYWWFTYSFVSAYNEQRELFPRDLIDNFELLVRLILLEDTVGVGGNFDIPITMLDSNGDIDTVLNNTNVLATYLGYPTIEGFTKIACQEDIEIDGTIKPGKKIRKLGPPKHREYYTPSTKKEDGICSNLGALLWHYEKEIARPEHTVRLEKMREEIGNLYNINSDKVYGFLKDERNHSLHGQRQGKKERGMILNLCCMLIWMTLYP